MKDFELIFVDLASLLLGDQLYGEDGESVI